MANSPGWVKDVCRLVLSQPSHSTNSPHHHHRGRDGGLYCIACLQWQIWRTCATRTRASHCGKLISNEISRERWSWSKRRIPVHTVNTGHLRGSGREEELVWRPCHAPVNRTWCSVRHVFGGRKKFKLKGSRLPSANNLFSWDMFHCLSACLLRYKMGREGALNGRAMCWNFGCFCKTTTNREVIGNWTRKMWAYAWNFSMYD